MTDPLPQEAVPLSEAAVRAMWARAEQATRGPWESKLQPGQTERHTYSHMVASGSVPSGIIHTLKRVDADFIAAARQDVPNLARECLRLREENAALRLALEERKGEYE